MARPKKPDVPVSRPGPRGLFALVALGTVTALWSVFLWMQLVAARAGARPFCGPGDDASCGALWDGPFARAVHTSTGLPVAAWGVAWGLAALLLPLLALMARAEDRHEPALVAATRWAAVGGAAIVLVLAAASLAAGEFCLGCLVVYLLVGAYAGLALPGWRADTRADRLGGFGRVAGLTAAAVLLLLYPGLHTPRAPTDAAAEATERALTAENAAPAPAGTGDAARDRQLFSLVESLTPEMRQTLSDSLAVYRRSPARPPARTRALVGPPTAPLRITEFTDVRCPHCADLHRTLASLRARAPLSFQIEPRQFPLDAACNPAMRQRGADPVRCLAARAQICLEDHPRGFEFAGALFEAQERLTEKEVRALFTRFGGRGREACLADAETQARLEEDAREASRHDFDGTPLVLVNGRKGTSFGPFLYAMVLTEGQDGHPAFAALPPPRADAHVH
jgi:protein-disulfide isomerase